MKIVVISGSSRAQSQSLKIAHWALKKLEAKGHQVELIDLHATQLPLDTDLDVEEDISEDPRALKAWEPVGKKVKDADGYLIISPEWNGSIPPALLNFFTYSSTDGTGLPLAHRPLQLFTVSSGRGGDYPVSQLRAYGQKNNLGVYIPCFVVIRDCANVFNSHEPEPDNSADQYLQTRALHSLDVLIDYADALKTMRKNATINLLEYPYGM